MRRMQRTRAGNTGGYRTVKKCLQDGAESAIKTIGEFYHEDKSAHLRN